MGKPSRDKGRRFELECVHRLQDIGLAAERVPLSGSAGGRYAGDISVPVNGRDWTFEAKCGRNRFASIYNYLSDHDGLFIKADRHEPLVVLPWARFRVLVEARES